MATVTLSLFVRFEFITNSFRRLFHFPDWSRTLSTHVHVCGHISIKQPKSKHSLHAELHVFHAFSVKEEHSGGFNPICDYYRCTFLFLSLNVNKQKTNKEMWMFHRKYRCTYTQTPTDGQGLLLPPPRPPAWPLQ